MVATRGDRKKTGRAPPAVCSRAARFLRAIRRERGYKDLHGRRSSAREREGRAACRRSSPGNPLSCLVLPIANGEHQWARKNQHRSQRHRNQRHPSRSLKNNAYFLYVCFFYLLLSFLVMVDAHEVDRGTKHRPMDLGNILVVHNPCRDPMPWTCTTGSSPRSS